MRKQIIRAYLTLPSVSHLPLLVLRSFSDAVAGVGGLDSCVCHNSGQDSRSNWGDRTLARPGTKQERILAPFPCLSSVCSVSSITAIVLHWFARDFLIPGGKNCHALEACGLKGSRSAKRKQSKDKTSSGSGSESKQVINAL